MPLHLVKLCVGADTVEDLEAWIRTRLSSARKNGRSEEQTHTTRMIPRRTAELLDGGSLYWVIKGNIQVRQRLVDIRPLRDPQGIRRCNLVLEPVLMPTQWQPRRAFQGWRYLKESDAPPDEPTGSGRVALPPDLRRELAELGLL